MRAICAILRTIAILWVAHFQSLHAQIAVHEIVSRELSVNLSPDAGQPRTVAELYSREISVNVAPAAGQPRTVAELYSRELSVNVAPGAGQPRTVAELYSRELSVNVAPGAGQPRTVAELYSRELSVNVAPGAGQPRTVAELYSREISVNLDPEAFAGSKLLAIFSREISVNLEPFAGQARDVAEVYSRELSVRTQQADLQVFAVDTPPQAIANNPVTIGWSEKNLGDFVAKGPWIERIYLSTNSTAGDADDLLVGTQFVIAANETILPGQVKSRSHVVLIPDTISGERWVVIRTDVNNDLAEIDEYTTNLAITTKSLVIAPEPVTDLQITSIVAPASGFDGEKANLSWTVENKGTKDSPTSVTWVDRIFLSADSVAGNADDILLGTSVPNGPLAVAENYVGFAEVTIPAGLSGDYWFVVDVDAGTGNGVVEEKHGGETNNLVIAQSPTLVIKNNLPDFIVHKITLKTTGPIFSGQTATIEYTVKNNSANGTANGKWTDSVYLSNDAVFNDPISGSGDLQVVKDDHSDSAFGPMLEYIRPATFKVPSTPGTYYYFVRTDATSAILETEESNNLAYVQVTVVDPSYTATIQTAVTEALGPSSLGSVLIPMTGQAIDKTTQQPVGDVPVTVRVVNKKTTRVFTLDALNQPIKTDAQGNFSFTFVPVPGEAGNYQIYANHPAVTTNDPNNPQDTFALIGVDVVPSNVVASVKEGASTSKTVTLKNRGDNHLLSIAGQPLSGSGPNLNWQADVPVSLGGLGQVDAAKPLTFDIQSTGPSPNPSVPIKASTDVLVPVNGVPTKAATSTVDIYVMPLVPSLTAVPAQLGSAADYFEIPIYDTKVVPITIKNLGDAPATDLHVFLTSTQNPEILQWANLVSPEHPDPILPNSEGTIEVAFQLPKPPLVVPDQTFTGSIRIEFAESPTPKTIPFVLRATSDLKGALEVRVEDELTYYGIDAQGQGVSLGGQGPRVSGAEVKVFDAVDGGLVAAKTTDGTGIVQFNSLNEAHYLVKVSAAKHGSYEKILEINAGQQVAISAFLPSQAVTYEWTVVPTEFQDEYIITIEAVFETFVPVPVVTVKPELVTLPQSPGQEIQVDYVIENHGLIAANGVELVIADPPGYDIAPIATYFGVLGAGEKIVVPTRITKLNTPAGLAASDCVTTFQSGCRWYLVCVNEVWHWVPMYYQYTSTNCPGGSVGGGGAPGGGGGGGSPSDPYVPPPDFTTEVTCETPPDPGPEGPPPCDCCGGVTGTTGSAPPPAGGVASEHNPTKPINLWSGEEVLTEVDMRIPGRGFDFVWSRRYRSKIGPHTVMGRNWDFAFGSYIERTSTKAIVHDGNGRADFFVPDLNKPNTWVRDEFFVELIRNNDGTYTILHPDKKRYHFHPVSASSVVSGKLFAIEDRNGNLMEIFHDSEGRVKTIVDTLGRPIVLEYGASGYLSSITDFAGRVVRYEHYQLGDENGSPGDLKSVTTPAVTGTSTGNDYPNGKTTVYTYSTGFQDDRLNHNLLTITDAKGQTFLRNVYHATQNPQDRNFDRVITQYYGDAEDRTDLFYVPMAPSASNGYTVTRTILNDNEGKVKEYDFDLKNRLIALREYTGFADPDQRTTVNANRPTGKLRSDDPDYFETKWAYNVDAMVTKIVHPNGNRDEFVWEIDQNPDAPRRSRGNLRIMRHELGSYPDIGDQKKIVETFSYEDDYGGCCGHNFVKFHTDARGNVFENQYDSAGNRIFRISPIQGLVEEWKYNAYGQIETHILPANGSGHRRRDEYAYYGGGPQQGYLYQEIVDAPGEAITTTYEHDAVGNVTRRIDARGHDTLYEVNALNQVVREQSRQVTLTNAYGGSSTARYQTRYFYDANDNLVRVDRQNVDETGSSVGPNPFFTTIVDYEILNEPTRVAVEESSSNPPPSVLTTAGISDPSNYVISEYEYDANRELVRYRSGEAVSGNDPNHEISRVLDERDLPFRITRAPNDKKQKSTTQIDYDRNGNATKVRIGMESNSPRVWTMQFDGFDRLIETKDPMGNRTEYHFDPNYNLTRETAFGELLDVGGGKENLRLAETAWTYDKENRVTQRDLGHFDPTNQAPFGDGISRTTIEWADDSQVRRLINDNGHSTTLEFDSVNRIKRRIDAKGNIVAYEYDKNSNETKTTETDKSDVGGTDEVFVTTREFDELDRHIETTDNLGHVTRRLFDSRDNEVATVDPRGNRVFAKFDGLSREIERIRNLTADGTGVGALVDTIVTKQSWDKASRLRSQTDDNGNATLYVLDSLDRRTSTVNADGTSATTEYDVFGDSTKVIDENGTVVLSDFDSLGRVRHKSVIPGAGVSTDTTFENHSYDGRSRLVRAEDDDSVVARRWDSLNSLLSDQIDGVGATAVYDGVGNRLTLNYPSGRVVTTTFDELERKKVIADAQGWIAKNAYIGPHRVAQREQGNNTLTLWGYDGDRRPNSIRLIGDPSGAANVLANRALQWDPADNKTFEADVVAGTNIAYTLDSVNRLIRSVRGGAQSPLTIDYVLDGVGNRSSVVGGPDAGAYSMSSAKPEPADLQVNQYTSAPGRQLTYTKKGEIQSSQETTEQWTYLWDHAGNLTRAQEQITGKSIEFAYDALGRCVRKDVSIAGVVKQELAYWLDQDRIELRDAIGGPAFTIISDSEWDLMQFAKGGVSYFVHRDEQLTARSTHGLGAALVESYSFTDYGTPSVIAPNGTTSLSSNVGNEWLYAGLRYDSVAKSHQSRTRWYDARIGRFYSGDWLGVWHDSSAFGGRSAYAANSPSTIVDPEGEEGRRKVKRKTPGQQYDKRRRGRVPGYVGMVAFGLCEFGAGTPTGGLGALGVLSICTAVGIGVQEACECIADPAGCFEGKEIPFKPSLDNPPWFVPNPPWPHAFPPPRPPVPTNPFPLFPPPLGGIDPDGPAFSVPPFRPQPPLPPLTDHDDLLHG